MLKSKFVFLSILLFPTLLFAHGDEAASVINKAVNNQHRLAKEVVRDQHRKPAAILKLLGVRPGMKVADLSSGSGYYTDILSRIVGDNGHVFAHNVPFVINRFPDTFKKGGTWDKRLSSADWKKNVSKLVSDLDQLSLEKPVDLALMVLFYHDTVWQKTDRAKMNKAVFNAVKPGGNYLIIDHSAEKGSGGRDVQSLHRIDKELVIKEVTAAGFELVKDAELLSNPEDSRDYNVFRDAKTKRDQTDRFVLKFIRP